MPKRFPCGRTGIPLAQPAQRQFEYRPRPVKTAVVPLEFAQCLRGGHSAKLRQLRHIQSVDPGQNLAELAREFWAGLRELLIAQNLARDGLALDPLHDEAGAEAVIWLQHMQHPRRRHAGFPSALHQDRLGIQPGRARGRCAVALWRAPQDRAEDTVGMHDIERPGFLAGAAGDPDGGGNAGRTRTPRRDAASEQRLPPLPLNFAGRFSRKAVTPSLKSSAAQAIRCDSNSRLSWSSNELSGLSQYNFRISDSATVGPFASSCASFMVSSIKAASS